MGSSWKDREDDRGAATLSAEIPVREPVPSSRGALGAADTLEAEQHPPPMPAFVPPLADNHAGTLSITGQALAAMPSGLVEKDIPTAVADMPMELPPSLKERFEDVQFLGRGGMGAVYRARDKRLGRDVALKLLFGGGADSTAQMLKEARSQARFEHENACKVYEVGVAEGQRYIMMQFVHGEPLDKAKTGMSLEEKVGIIQKVAAALHEAHRMGLIHRDVKPSNIMVEQSEDGAYKPYLMDFGLAREVGAGDHATRTGIVVGTPAFMSPEQALGHVRTLDRRSDVYSLGATLYELLCDKPPFMDDNMFRLLQRVAHEDSVPLRKVLPSIPEDLEIVVGKCLEKEPGRRYDSAKAFSDDLRRFLDGEPISVRKDSLGYVALKKLRRHKAKAVVAGVGLVMASALSIAWVSEQRKAEARELTARELGRELGEDVKEMELFLRNAYSLPLHDIERERKIVRERLSGIETRMASAGPAAEGPGHYALGRGYAALEEHEKARFHLDKAMKAGYSAPELDYALGLVLGELYKKALEETKRIENAEKKKAKISELEAEYKAPALKHLRAALGVRLEVPAYAEGLIALYEGRYEDARRYAKDAFEQAPWLFEAKKLEGDAYFAEGNHFRPDAAFDYDKMASFYEHASQAYGESAGIARSCSSVYEAECELFTQLILASNAKPESLKPSFERAKTACGRAINAYPKNGSAHIRLAFSYNSFAWQMINWHASDKETEASLQDAIERGEEVAKAHPQDFMAHYVHGAAYRHLAQYRGARGLAGASAIQPALDAYERSIRLNPSFSWPVQERCTTYTYRALSDLRQGISPEPATNSALLDCRRALEIEPSLIHIRAGLAFAHQQVAVHQINKGISPEPAIGAALKELEIARAQSQTAPSPLISTVYLQVLRALYAFDAGQDLASHLSTIGKGVEEIQKVLPDSAPFFEMQGWFSLLKAKQGIRKGDNPLTLLEEAKTAFVRGLEKSPADFDLLIPLAQAHILWLRWAIEHDKVKAAQLDEAFAPLVPLLDKERVIPHFYQSLADLHGLKAKWLAKKKLKGVREEIEKGLAMADKALKVNPTMALGFLARGNLWLLAAKEEPKGDKQKEAISKAKEALEAALKENPLLKREVEPLMGAVGTF